MKGQERGWEEYLVYYIEERNKIYFLVSHDKDLKEYFNRLGLVNLTLSTPSADHGDCMRRKSCRASP